MATTVETITQNLPALALIPSDHAGEARAPPSSETEIQRSYRYTHLLPHFSPETYPPLEPFEHLDPGFRALSHPNPTSFLNDASAVTELTPNLGTEIHGISLARLDADARDQLALLVSSVSNLVLLSADHRRPSPGCQERPRRLQGSTRIYRQRSRLLLGMGEALRTVIFSLPFVSCFMTDTICS